MKILYALVDCNNFYASCETVFKPSLRGQPVVVLSNNDGCAIARSQEAKALGIKMGQPIFKSWDLVKRYDIQVFSSNFVLYGDMSQRVMQALAEFTPQMEVYSIDEAFLVMCIPEETELYALGQKIQKQVKQKTGLPVSVGMGATKTLAKIANHIAKRTKHLHGVCYLTDSAVIDECLEKTALDDVWGIGRRIARWLKYQGIQTAYQLKQAPDSWIKKNLTVKGLRTVHELRGIPCIPLERVPPAKKAISTSRSFGYEVKSLAEMLEAVSAYTARTAEKLRRQHSLAGYIQIYIESNPFKSQKYYQKAVGAQISPPSAYTPLLVRYGRDLLKKIYHPGYAYKKVGVLLTHLSQEDQEQHFLFCEDYSQSRRQRLMQVMDQINQGMGKICFAGEGLGKPWYMRQLHKSKRYTTRWEELPEIFI